MDNTSITTNTGHPKSRETVSHWLYHFYRVDGLTHVVKIIVSSILAVKLKMIKQDRMIFGDFSVNFEPISLKFRRDPFLLKKFAKLYLLFQKLGLFRIEIFRAVNGKWPLQNLKEIGSELTEKSPKIMRSWLI